MVILLYWLFAGQYQYLQTSTFQRKNKIFFILNLVGNWASLLTIRKTTGKELKIAMTNQRLKNVLRASFRVWGLTR